jgi:hypothetical protein
MNHPPDSISRCRELIAVAISQIDCDPIVGDCLVDPALEITVAHFKKIIALQRACRRNPMTHENAEDLTANILVGRSIKHRSTIGFARHRSYGRTATVDKIAQPLVGSSLRWVRCLLCATMDGTNGRCRYWIPKVLAMASESEVMKTDRALAQLDSLG